MSRTSQAAAARPAASVPLTTKLAKTLQANAAADAEHEASLAIERRHTSVAEAGVHKPAGVPASVFEAGQLARPARKPRKPTVLIDLATIVIEVGVALPDHLPRATTQAYNTLLAQLVPGTSVLLATNQAKTLLAAAKKRGLNVVSRVVDDQRSRVWCLPKAGAVATGHSSAASSAAALIPITGVSA